MDIWAANIILKVPVSLMEAAVWVFHMYYVMGFAPAAGSIHPNVVILLPSFQCLQIIRILIHISLFVIGSFVSL